MSDCSAATGFSPSIVSADAVMKVPTSGGAKTTLFSSVDEAIPGGLSAVVRVDIENGFGRLKPVRLPLRELRYCTLRRRRLRLGTWPSR